GDAVPALLRHPAGGCDRGERASAQGVAAPRNVAVHRDEPLRRVAENDGLLRAPGVRILVLEPAAGDEHARLAQGGDSRVIRITLLSLPGEHALAGKSRRLCRESAVGVDRERDCGVDAARPELRLVRGPDLEVLAAVARRGMHEPGSGIVADVLA